VIPQPSITMIKTSSVLSDPTGRRPEAHSAAVVQYDITVTTADPVRLTRHAVITIIAGQHTMYVSTTRRIR